MSSLLNALLERLRKVVRFIFTHRLARYSMYVGIFWFSFIAFAYFSFPYDRLKDLLIEKAESGELGLRNVQLDIDELSPSLFVGVALEGVKLTFNPAPGADASEPPDVLRIDELEVHVSPLRYLFGTLALDIEAELGGGSIEGEFDTSENAQRLEMELEEVNLGVLSPIKRALGLPILGIATGTVNLDLPEELPEGTGEIMLEVQNMKIGDGKNKLKIPGMQDGLTISPISLGTLQIEIPVEGGTGKVRKLRAKGKDAELDGSGTIRLARPLGGTSLDLTVRTKLTKAYRTRDDASRRLTSAMDFIPQLRSATTADGSLQFRLSGTFRGSINARPAGTALR